MTREEVLKKIKEILEINFGITNPKEKDTLDDYMFDEFDLVDFRNFLEEEFKIEFNENDYPPLITETTVKEIVTFIYNKFN